MQAVTEDQLAKVYVALTTTHDLKEITAEPDAVVKAIVLMYINQGYPDSFTEFKEAFRDYQRKENNLYHAEQFGQMLSTVTNIGYWIEQIRIAVTEDTLAELSNEDLCKTYEYIHGLKRG